MSRSIWKGPFVDPSLIKKVEKQKNATNMKPIKPWSRKSTIIPEFVGVSFLIHNGKKFILITISEDMVGQVIPSVSPGRGAEYFHKTECFCFEQQKLLAGERLELPVVFIVDPNIPLDIGSLSLGYTLFDITDQLSKNQIAAL